MKRGYIKHNGYCYSYKVTQQGMLFKGEVTTVESTVSYSPKKLVSPIFVEELGSDNVRRSLVKAIHKAPLPIDI